MYIEALAQIHQGASALGIRHLLLMTSAFYSGGICPPVYPALLGALAF